MKPGFSTDDSYQTNHLLCQKEGLLKEKVMFPLFFSHKTGSFKTALGRDTSKGVNFVDRFPIPLGNKGSGKEIGCLEERNNIKSSRAFINFLNTNKFDRVIICC